MRFAHSHSPFVALTAKTSSLTPAFQAQPGQASPTTIEPCPPNRLAVPAPQLQTFLTKLSHPQGRSSPEHVCNKVG